MLAVLIVNSAMAVRTPPTNNATQWPPRYPVGLILATVSWRIDQMTYVNPNFKTKTELVRAVKTGALVSVFEPGLGAVPVNGTVYLEGPHYPQPHKWYAEGTMKDGILVKVK
jgi:hypothetical protein